MDTYDERPRYMHTSDRVQQCDWLREVAAETYGYFVADPEDRYTGEQVVAAWEEQLRDSGGELPDWYDEHDRRLLAGYIQERLDTYWAEHVA